MFPESATRLALEKQPPYFQEKLVTICKTGWKVNIWNGFHICLHSSVGKESACSTGDPGLIPGSGRSPGAGNGNPLQYSCLENPIDRGAWWATVHGVSWIRHVLATKHHHLHDKGEDTDPTTNYSENLTKFTHVFHPCYDSTLCSDFALGKIKKKLYIYLFLPSI